MFIDMVICMTTACDNIENAIFALATNGIHRGCILTLENGRLGRGTGKLKLRVGYMSPEIGSG